MFSRKVQPKRVSELLRCVSSEVSRQLDDTFDETRQIKCTSGGNIDVGLVDTSTGLSEEYAFVIGCWTGPNAVLMWVRFVNMKP